jgi:hypothetical protein
MSLELRDSLVLWRPELFSFKREDLHFFLDVEAPNWIATDRRGAAILEWINGKRTLGEIRRLYVALSGADWGPAWRDVQVFVREALASGIISDCSRPRSTYKGRVRYLKPESLRELWLHLLQTCNLSCSHCLVSSGPKGEPGPRMDFLLGIIDEALALYQKALEIDPHSQIVKTNIELLLSSSGGKGGKGDKNQENQDEQNEGEGGDQDKQKQPKNPQFAENKPSQ